MPVDTTDRQKKGAKPCGTSPTEPAVATRAPVHGGRGPAVVPRPGRLDGAPRDLNLRFANLFRQDATEEFVEQTNGERGIAVLAATRVAERMPVSR